MSLREKNSTYALYWAEQRKLKMQKARVLKQERERRARQHEIEGCTFKPKLYKGRNKFKIVSEYNQSYISNFHYKDQPYYFSSRKGDTDSENIDEFNLNDASLAQEFASFSSRERLIHLQRNKKFDQSTLISLKKRMAKRQVKRPDLPTSLKSKESNSEPVFSIPEFAPKQVLIQCNFCLRKFNKISLTKHEIVCQRHRSKMAGKQTFDARAKRLKEFYQSANDKSVLSQAKLVTRKISSSTTWQKKSKQLRAAIKATTDVQEKDDYKECPFCGRTFNENAAERHIPRCQLQKNKPKRLLKGAGNYASNKSNRSQRIQAF